MDTSTHKGYERQRPIAAVVAEVPAVTEVMLMMREWLHELTSPDVVTHLAGLPQADVVRFLDELNGFADDIMEAEAIISEAVGIDPTEDVDAPPRT